MTTLVCAILGFLIIFLPFLPSVIEVVRSSDSSALKITNHILKDPRFSPELLLWHFAHLVGSEDLMSLRNLAKVNEPTLLNNAILAVPAGKLGTLDRNISRTNYMSKIVSLDSIKTGVQNAINEVHAKERLLLKARSKVMWWASGTDILIEDRVALPGKVQAERSIEFHGRAQFHHLDAPLIQMLDSLPKNDTTEFFVQTATRPIRHFFGKDLELSAGENREGDFIVKGDLLLRENATIHGNVKCHKRVTLMKGARISGNLVSIGDLTCLGKNWIGGSILGQKNISFSGPCHVGSENQRVTVSGNTIQIKPPFRSHGTIRAWRSGVIEEQVESGDLVSL